MRIKGAYLLGKYKVSEKKVTEDVYRFVAKLRKNGLLEK